jgi:hypothetical protein
MRMRRAPVSVRRARQPALPLRAARQALRAWLAPLSRVRELAEQARVLALAVPVVVGAQGLGWPVPVPVLVPAVPLLAALQLVAAGAARPERPLARR